MKEELIGEADGSVEGQKQQKTMGWCFLALSCRNLGWGRRAWAWQAGGMSHPHIALSGKQIQPMACLGALCVGGVHLSISPTQVTLPETMQTTFREMLAQGGWLPTSLEGLRRG